MVAVKKHTLEEKTEHMVYTFSGTFKDFKLGELPFGGYFLYESRGPQIVI
ncbi:hypothetical protein J4409_01760 [Candidatus Woesearchaeota archaeon]|nr:hypothetical protein [Candidatus Woesearchaeota archaeon]